MKTLKITNISELNSKTLITLSSNPTWNIGDRVFIYGGDLDNTNKNRNPFSTESFGYTILNITNNTILIDKTYSSSFINSIDKWISNIVINESWILPEVQNTTISINEGLILNSIISRPNENTIAIDTNSISFYANNTYINNSEINYSNLGKYYYLGYEEINTNTICVIENSIIGNNNKQNYIWRVNSKDTSFTNVEFFGGEHKSIDTIIEIKDSVINSGNYNDIIFTNCSINNATITSSGIPITAIAIDDINNPVSITVYPTYLSKINTDYKYMLFNWGYSPILNWDPIYQFIANDFIATPLTIKDLTSTTFKIDYKPEWNTHPSYNNYNAFLTLSALNNCTINNSSIEYTAVKSDSMINIENCYIKSSYIDGAILKNNTYIKDFKNVTANIQNSIVYDNIQATLVNNSYTMNIINNSDIRNSITLSSLNNSKIIDSFIVEGDFSNNYSDNIAIKNMNYWGGILPINLTTGTFNNVPYFSSNNDFTYVDVPVDLNPKITFMMKELWDGSNYYVPQVGDYLAINVFNAKQNYEFYLKVTDSIITDILNLNNAHLNMLARPQITYNIIGIKENTNFQNYITGDNNCIIGVYKPIQTLYPTNINIDLGYKSLVDNEYYFDTTINATLGPFIPAVKIEVVPNHPDTNTIPGQTLYIQDLSFYITNTGGTISYTSNLPDVGPIVGQTIPDKNVTNYNITSNNLIFDLYSPYTMNYDNFVYNIADEIELTLNYYYKLEPTDTWTLNTYIKTITFN